MTDTTIARYPLSMIRLHWLTVIVMVMKPS